MAISILPVGLPLDHPLIPLEGRAKVRGRLDRTRGGVVAGDAVFEETEDVGVVIGCAFDGGLSECQGVVWGCWEAEVGQDYAGEVLDSEVEEGG
jgi:hypothetical protein